MRFNVILFDLDNTLVDRAAAFARYLERAGLNPAGRDVLTNLDDQGYAPRSAFCDATVKLFPTLAKSPEAFWSDFAAGLVQGVEPVPRTSNAVKRLAEAGYTLGVISNGSGSRQRAKLQRAGLQRWFVHDRVVVSGEEGVAKPDPRIFDRAVARCSQPAESVLFVGDDPIADIAGARNAGLATCWVANGRQQPSDLDATFTIDHVEELCELLSSAGTE